MKKIFTVLSKDGNLVEEAKKFPCLNDKSSPSYRNRGNVRYVWAEVAEKLEFLEDGKCC